MEKRRLVYALITAARNEERFIQGTIQSVISQTVLPLRWIICTDDGSTDGTEEIIKHYAANYSWISHLRMPEREVSPGRVKARCIMASYRQLKGLAFDIIGNLDADITFQSDYIEFLLNKLSCDPSLGVVGTRFLENGRQKYNYKFVNEEHVTGCCQIFRRDCFEEIGGYLSLPCASEDWIAVTTARLKGWKTRSYMGKAYTHHRTMGSGFDTMLRSRLRYGEQDYLTGGHPVWETFRGLLQMRQRPYILGGICLLLGYFRPWLRNVERPVSSELIRFHRAEQMRRLRAMLLGSGRN